MTDLIVNGGLYLPLQRTVWVPQRRPLQGSRIKARVLRILLGGGARLFKTGKLLN